MKITKGIVFAGCSFTWGQGLYYYSGLETLKEPAPDCYDGLLVTDAHKRYMATLRYPRLVANHFNTFEIVSKQNGGSEDMSIKFLNQLFDLPNIIEPNEYLDLANDKISYNEIEYIIIQLSQPHRNKFYFNHKGENYFFCVDRPETKAVFYEWLFEANINLSYSQWFETLVQTSFNNIKDKMQFFESKGIKTKVLTWEPYYVSLLNSDEWMSERFIPLYFNDVKYDCIRDLMYDSNTQGLIINNDHEHFENPPKDHHPSLRCHQIIAENVIKKIQEDYDR